MWYWLCFFFQTVSTALRRLLQNRYMLILICLQAYTDIIYFFFFFSFVLIQFKRSLSKGTKGTVMSLSINDFFIVALKGIVK